MREPETFGADFDCPVCGRQIRSLHNIATEDEHGDIRHRKYEACIASHGRNIVAGCVSMLRDAAERRRS